MSSHLSKTVRYVIAFSALLFCCFIGLFIYYLPKIKEVQTAFIRLKSHKREIIFASEADAINYKNKMIDFISMENMATGIFPIDTTLAAKENSLSDINDIGIYYWNRSLEVLNSLNELNMPYPLVKKNKICKEYCILNRKCYELIYKAVNERTEKYDQEIKKYAIKIEEKKTYLKANY